MNKNKTEKTRERQGKEGDKRKRERDRYTDRQTDRREDIIHRQETKDKEISTPNMSTSARRRLMRDFKVIIIPFPISISISFLLHTYLDYHSNVLSYSLPSACKQILQQVFPPPPSQIMSWHGMSILLFTLSSLLSRRYQKKANKSTSFSSLLVDRNAVIIGPADTPFEDGTFRLVMQFEEQYPNKPPTVKFISKMFHPNVYGTGELCLDILQNRWSPTYDVAAILTSIQRWDYFLPSFSFFVAFSPQIRFIIWFWLWRVRLIANRCCGDVLLVFWTTQIRIHPPTLKRRICIRIICASTRNECARPWRRVGRIELLRAMRWFSLVLFFFFFFTVISLLYTGLNRNWSLKSEIDRRWSMITYTPPHHTSRPGFCFWSCSSLFMCSFVWWLCWFFLFFFFFFIFSCFDSACLRAYT